MRISHQKVWYMWKDFFIKQQLRVHQERAVCIRKQKFVFKETNIVPVLTSEQVESIVNQNNVPDQLELAKICLEQLKLEVRLAELSVDTKFKPIIIKLLISIFEW